MFLWVCDVPFNFIYCLLGEIVTILIWSNVLMLSYVRGRRAGGMMCLRKFCNTLKSWSYSIISSKSCKILSCIFRCLILLECTVYWCDADIELNVLTAWLVYCSTSCFFSFSIPCLSLPNFFMCVELFLDSLLFKVHNCLFFKSILPYCNCYSWVIFSLPLSLSPSLPSFFLPFFHRLYQGMIYIQ